MKPPAPVFAGGSDEEFALEEAMNNPREVFSREGGRTRLPFTTQLPERTVTPLKERPCRENVQEPGISFIQGGVFYQRPRNLDVSPFKLPQLNRPAPQDVLDAATSRRKQGVSTVLVFRAPGSL